MTLVNGPEINLLIKLLLAHFISDFVLQTNWIIKYKEPFKKGMLLHIAITIVVAGLLTQYWLLAAAIGIMHYGVDIAKYYASEKWPQRKIVLFITDQLIHIMILVIAWSLIIDKPLVTWRTLQTALSQNQSTLIILGYIICIWPIGFLVGMATKHFIKQTSSNPNGEDDVEHGGRIIGIFERIIILTFVLFGQYEAIGFLITGKSILRLNSKRQTEYVLAGTMLSYALSIITGVLINYFLKYV